MSDPDGLLFPARDQDDDEKLDYPVGIDVEEPENDEDG